MPQSQEHALHIHPHHRIEHRLVVFRGRGDVAFDAGVVVEAVDRSVRIERCLHIGLHIGGFGHVGSDEQRLAALLADDAGGAFAAGRITIHHHDPGSVAREADSGGASDAIAGAGDQRDLALEVHGFLRCLRFLDPSTGGVRRGTRAAPPPGRPRHRTRTNVPPLYGTSPPAVRHSTISALPNTVRVHMPTGKAERCRSSAQNALIVQAARGPDTDNAVSRCDTSTMLPAAANVVGSFALSSASISHSSGPSHRAAQPDDALLRHGTVGSATPNMLPIAVAAC